jgi:hypothetical protein
LAYGEELGRGARNRAIRRLQQFSENMPIEIFFINFAASVGGAVLHSMQNEGCE